MKLTHHGEERLRKRHGLPKRTAEKVATLAREHGKREDEFTGTFRRYLDKFYIPYRQSGSHLYVYNGGVYVFQGDKLITTWRVPGQFHKQAHK